VPPDGRRAAFVALGDRTALFLGLCPHVGIRLGQRLGCGSHILGQLRMGERGVGMCARKSHKRGNEFAGFEANERECASLLGKKVITKRVPYTVSNTHVMKPMQKEKKKKTEQINIGVHMKTENHTDKISTRLESKAMMGLVI
jgi:hypothetical protein